MSNERKAHAFPNDLGIPPSKMFDPIVEDSNRDGNLVLSGILPFNGFSERSNVFMAENIERDFQFDGVYFLQVDCHLDQDAATGRDFQVDVGLNPADKNSQQDLSIPNEKESQTELEFFRQNEKMKDQATTFFAIRTKTGFLYHYDEHMFDHKKTRKFITSGHFINFLLRILVGLPSVENREMILKILLAKEKHENLDFKELATMTEGYTGSDLKNLCITAAYRPVRELIQQERMKEMVAASFASEGSVMNELKHWNDLYGEGGSRKKQQLT
ncbi:hypothetical protein D0Y65_044031 [Glycine soja]|uniref:AAA ATPase AAA+ lid domain-containing protein n=1 Tax=Glycine soja TaxID=3848 RepID=A0A445GJZ7_GLYSO|nr:hypothetical protein D0Y65_044031 [Glycine soja]